MRNVIDKIATGKKLKELMEREGKSVKEISNTFGISETSVYKWLNGESLPSLNHLVGIVYYLRSTLDETLIPYPQYMK